jgi:hypothetical protein
LVGEGADQLDLPLGEGLDTLAGKNEHAHRLAIVQQRHAEHRPEPADRDSLRYHQLGISSRVRDMDSLTFEQSPAGDGREGRGEELPSQKSVELGHESGGGSDAIDITLAG